MKEIRCVTPSREQKDGRRVYRCPRCGFPLKFLDWECHGCGSFVDWNKWRAKDDDAGV